MAMSRSATALSRLTMFSLLACAAASAPAQGRFKVSADGEEVLDTTTQLTWRRCVEGMHWDGQACAGKPAKFSYAGAKKARPAQRRGACRRAKSSSAWSTGRRRGSRGSIAKRFRTRPRCPCGRAAPAATTTSTPGWSASPTARSRATRARRSLRCAWFAAAPDRGRRRRRPAAGCGAAHLRVLVFRGLVQLRRELSVAANQSRSPFGLLPRGRRESGAPGRPRGAR